MSLIIIDNSVQLQTAGLNPDIINNITTSNSYTLLSDFLSNNSYINSTKQNLLTASTILSGIGSNLTSIDYNKITLNKPVNFQSDWNSSIINKPTNFQADWNSTIINKPTNFQSDWNSTIINKPTNFQCDYNTTLINKPTNFQCDYNTTLINKPTNFQADWNSTIINKPSTFNPDLSSIYTKNQVDTIANLSNFYNKTTMDTSLNSKENVLSFSAPLTRNTNTIGINLNSYVPFTALSASNYITNSTNGLINYPTYSILNSSNYITNNTNGLINYPSYSILNSSNYITNNTNGLINYPTYSILNSCNYSSGTNFLKLDGTNTMSAQLSLTGLASGTNPLYISSTNINANNCIQIKNNSTYNAYIGIGGTGFGGNYANNFFIESAQSSIIFNTNGRTSANVPNMIVHSSGNIGIGTGIPNYKLHVRGTTPAIIRIETDFSAINEVSGIEFGIPAFSSANSAKILSKSISGDKCDLSFYTAPTTNASTLRMVITENGNVGIGTNNPSTNILQIGGGGRLKIGSGTTDYSLIGTLDTDSGTNTRIVISGNTRTSFAGNIEYLATSTGSHIFYTNNGSERMRINSGGNVLIGNPNINLAGVPINSTCKLYVSSQIGTPSTCYPLRICAGSASDTNNNATIIGLGSEANGWSKAGIAHIRTGAYDQGDIVFLNRNTADGTDCTLSYERMRIYSGGGVNINQGLSVGGNIQINNSSNTKLIFDNFLNDFKIQMWDGYGFGINSGTLRYNSGTYHTFYNDSVFSGKIYNKGLLLNSAEWSSGGIKGIFFRDGYDVANNNNYNCSILTYDHNGDGFCDGLSINGYDGISFCTGANTRNERMRIYSYGGVNISGTLTTTGLTCGGAGVVNFDGNASVNFNGSFWMYCYRPAYFDNSFYLRLTTTTSQNPHDYVGVPYETASGSTAVYQLYLILNSFTGLHRCFTNDELFNEDEPQLFKDTYEGRIVVASGKIATQIGNEKDGYEINYDKSGITIEDAHPIIELSRKKKDKRVFGVLGRRDRKNSNEKRLIINSIGEGGIWVINSNGNIENGEYITSSDYLGYGEKQEDDILHNYSVAKSTIDCSFELNSPYYNCYEIDDLDINGNKLKIAFISCSYHCG